jgi:cytochrome c556
VNGTSRALLTALALLLVGGLAAPTRTAAQDASPEAQYRQSLMGAFRLHTGAIRAALGGAAPLGHAVHHAIAFESMAQSLANAFPSGSGGPGSRALPAIWADRDDLMDKVTAIQMAAAELVSAARSGDEEAIGAALQAAQGTCRGCHGTYRGPATN